MLNAVARVAVAVDNLPCIGTPWLPGEEVVRCSSENGLDGVPILIVGEGLAESD